jgi:hypothetical protein
MGWSEMVCTWGTSAEERERRFPCDGVLPDANEAYYRGVTVSADPPTVFSWLCQLRVAPYSYDWIDNFGRTSPRELTPDLENLELAQRFMSIFDLVEFERNVHITLRLRSPGLFPLLAVSYCIDPESDSSCRLLVKRVVQFRPGLRSRLSRRLGPSLDWVMMRRQLLNLKALAEGDVRPRG